MTTRVMLLRLVKPSSVRTLTNRGEGDDDRPQVTRDPVVDVSFQNDNLNRGGADMEEPSVRPRVAPTPVPRRSGRATIQPEWMTSGEYVMAATSSETPEWVAKANFIKSISESVPVSMQAKILDALIHVMSK